MVFAPGPRFTSVFQWFLTSCLLWSSSFSSFSILLLGGLFSASFLQCFSKLLLGIPPGASLSTWFLIIFNVPMVFLRFCHKHSPLALGFCTICRIVSHFSWLRSLYRLIRYGSRFFFGAGQCLNQLKLISLNLLHVSSTSQSQHIFSVFSCRWSPKFRCRNVC